jgi:hypothetical protein
MSLKTNSSTYKDKDHIYYNVTITNSSTDQLLPAQFFESRTDALIQNPENWYMAAVKFTIPTDQIWLFTFDAYLFSGVGVFTAGSAIVDAVDYTVSSVVFQSIISSEQLDGLPNPPGLIGVPITSTTGYIPPATTITGFLPSATLASSRIAMSAPSLGTTPAGNVTVFTFAGPFATNYAGYGVFTAGSNIITRVVFSALPFTNEQPKVLNNLSQSIGSKLTAPTFVPPLDFVQIETVAPLPHQFVLSTAAIGTTPPPPGTFTPFVLTGSPYIIQFVDGLNNAIVQLQVTDATPERQPFIWNYQMFINATNAAMFNAFTIIKAGGFAGNHAPYITINPQTNLMTITAENNFWYPQNPSGAEIQMTRILFEYYQGIPAQTFPILVPAGTVANFFTVLIQNYGQGAPGNPSGLVNIAFDPNGWAPPSAPYAAWQVTQEYSSLFIWNQFNKIIIKSGTLPIEYEYQPATASNPTNTGFGTQSGFFASSSASFSPTITDFDVPKTPQGFDRTPMQFVAQIYRYADMKGTTPMNRVDVQMYWQDKNLVERVINLNPGDSASLKLLFRRKSTEYADKA